MNSSGAANIANCSLLSTRISFASYAREINATTGFDVVLLSACQSEICNALWGDGNADISGVGMVVGYTFESVLGLLFALGLGFQRPVSRTRYSEIYSSLLLKGCSTFFDCAVFFAVSIQISCVVVLVRRDFGISANGLGGFTTQITWAIALLCMLPLIYPLMVLGHISPDRGGYRFFLFCGCWVLFFYTFISQMIGDFAPSQVGQGAGEGGATIITTDEWNKLTALCLTGVRALSSNEQNLLSRFGAAGSLLVSAYGFIRLVYFIGERQWPSRFDKIREKWLSLFNEERRTQYLVIFWCVLITVLTIPQLWGVFRLRGIQRALADATSGAYVDNQWTFGQVVAVMIFAPVITELGYLVINHDPGERK